MIGAVIPTRFHPAQLAPLVEVLEGDGVYTIVQESEDFAHHLHRMWNDGVDRLRNVGCTEVAVLNDDIVMQPGTLAVMAQALHLRDRIAVVGPDTQIKRMLPLPKRVQVDDEMMNQCGYAFMFDPNDPDVPRFREDLRIWHGDLAFFDAVRAAGRTVATVGGLCILHEGSHSIKRIMGRAATDVRMGACLEDSLEIEARRGNDDAKTLLADTMIAQAGLAELDIPPPGRRASWDRARRMRARALG